MPYTGSPPSFTAGEKTGVAAKLNQLRDAIRGFTDPWSAYTPTITAQGGTPTTVTPTGKYMRVGKFVTVRVSVAVTHAGTATGFLIATLPVPPLADLCGLGASYDSAVGSLGVAAVLSGALKMAQYNNSTYWTNGANVHATVTYEAA